MKMAAVLLSMAVLAVAGCGKKNEQQAVSSNKYGEGQYSATIKPFVCSGCGSFMEKAMRGVFGIEKAVADDKSHQLQFVVAKGADVSEQALQDALKAAAEKMGMGADYTLSNITKNN